jgi:uncharacterized protein YdhG (YjbR/CyaY superfamily)
MEPIKSVDDYIAQAPKEFQPKLRQLRAAIKETAPGAEEKLSYGMPYYGFHGRLIYFSYWPTHLGIYAMPTSMKGYEAELKKYQSGKATLQISWDQELPLELIKKLITAQIKINESRKAR